MTQIVMMTGTRCNSMLVSPAKRPPPSYRSLIAAALRHEAKWHCMDSQRLTRR